MGVMEKSKNPYFTALPLFVAALLVGLCAKAISVPSLAGSKGVLVGGSASLGEMQLLEAVKFGKLTKVKQLIEKQNVSVKTVDPIFGQSVLIWAAARGHKKVVEYLVEEAGADIHSKSKTKVTALNMAASGNNADIVEYLYRRGAKLEVRSGEGYTPLLEAAAGGFVETFERLMSLGAKLAVRLPSGATPLMLAALHNHTLMLDKLFELGVDVNAKTKGGRTAIDMAVWGDHHEAIYKLLTKGAKVSEDASHKIVELFKDSARLEEIKTFLDLHDYVLEEQGSRASSLCDKLLSFIKKR